MKKLFVLIKKEVQELLTPQMIIPLVAVVFLFAFVGDMVGKETAKTQKAQPIEVVDLDKSGTSGEVIEVLKQSNLDTNLIEGNLEEIIVQARQDNKRAVLVIPEGFEAGIKNISPQKIEVYSIMNNFSVVGSSGNTTVAIALASVNEYLGNKLLKEVNSDADLTAAKSIARANNFVVIGERQANVSVQAVSGFISSQTTFIPIILSLVIIMASQLIAVSIASEKENKTLETLLSTPVNRQYIVASKLLGAGIVALIAAGIYMIGIRQYNNGLMPPGQAGSESLNVAMEQLGLTFGVGDYLLLGLSLFFGILTALSIAIILGSFAQDVKSSQGIIAPLTILILIPYFLTIFLDISSLPSLTQWAIYAIPFSHPFMAASNILLGQTQNVWYGIIYMGFSFLVFVYIASRLFASEKISSMNLDFRKLLKRGK